MSLTDRAKDLLNRKVHFKVNFCKENIENLLQEFENSKYDIKWVTHDNPTKLLHVVEGGKGYIDVDINRMLTHGVHNDGYAESAPTFEYEDIITCRTLDPECDTQYMKLFGGR